MTNAHEEARAHIEIITALVAAYNADYDRLNELREEREDLITAINDVNADAGAGEYRLRSAEQALQNWITENMDELQELEEQADGYECKEDVEQAIQEHPLSVEYRSGWTLPGQELEPAEFKVLLGTGGPHVEIVGDLDANRVRVLYADWGESGELHGFDHDAVEIYLNVVGVEAC